MKTNFKKKKTTYNVDKLKKKKLKALKKIHNLNKISVNILSKIYNDRTKIKIY